MIALLLCGMVMAAEPDAPAPSEEPAGDDEPAETDDRSALEDDLFGAPADDPPPEDTAAPPTDTPPAGRDDAILGDDPRLRGEGAIWDKLAAADDRVTLGGRLWLRLDGAYADGGDNVTMSSPNLLDLFLDARPNDRVRAYARGRLGYDWTVTEGALNSFGQPATRSEVLLDQLWLKFDVARRLYVTAGQQRVKWGAGRFWNPTDFLNQQRLDPLAVLDLRTGAPLIKLHLPLEKQGLNVYAVGSLDSVTAIDEVGGAFRVEALFGLTEASATVAVRKDQPLRLGMDVSTGISVFDVKIEGALLHGVTSPGWEGEFDLERLVFPTEVDRSDDWIPQVVANVEVAIRYNDEDNVALGIEGFYNGAGFHDRADLYPWLFGTGQFTPFYLGRWYAAAYVLLAAPGRWNDVTFIVSAIGNLSDRSVVGRFDYRHNVLTWLDVNAYATVHAGEIGEFRLAVDIPPVATVPGLENGLSIPAPLVEAGVGAAVRF